MDTHDTVVVYSFRVFDRNVETPHVPGYKGTREFVGGLLGGEILEGTAEEVDAGSLDEQGRYQRHPTGWGSFG